MKLFCLTHAGGSASFYGPLEKCLIPEFEVIKLEYSGHGYRNKESLYNTFDEMTEDMYRLILNSLLPGEKYALLGYSMGSIVAADVLHKILKDASVPNPCHIFLAAHEPKAKIELTGFNVDESDENIKARTIKFGAVPDTIINSRVFWRVYLPLYRNDYSLIVNYDFNQLKYTTDIPVTIFYSETDTPYAEIKAWSTVFTGLCNYNPFEGTHFFILDHYNEIASIIRNRLEQAQE